MADLTVTVTADSPPTVILSGEIDISTAPDLEQTASRLLAQGHPSLAIDLGGVTYLDSTGIGTMLRLCRQCRERGGQLHILSASARIHRLMRMLGIDHLLPPPPIDPGV